MNLRQMASRIVTSIARGVLTAVNDDAPTQLVQVETYDGVIADDVEHFQPWGLSFKPPTGAEVVVAAVGASQEHLIVFSATDRDIRPTGIKDGEGGLYTSTGWKVFCDADDVVHVAVKSGEDWIARADRVDAEIKAIRDAIINAKPGTGSPDSGAALHTSMSLPLNTVPQGETKSDKGKVT